MPGGALDRRVEEVFAAEAAAHADEHQVFAPAVVHDHAVVRVDNLEQQGELPRQTRSNQFQRPANCALAV
jgi:hypothetical protein